MLAVVVPSPSEASRSVHHNITKNFWEDVEAQRTMSRQAIALRAVLG